ncbi:MAG TPA: glycosyltransferase [Gemmatimonadota bacterium]|nr:glycosyltransferase [Gemmatimonadota bacterium]
MKIRHFLLTPVGSAGDVLPFLGIGAELRRRGHSVTLLAGEAFRESAAGAGLDFLAHWSEEDFEGVMRDPDLWHPQRGLRLVMRAVSAMLAPTYAALEALYEPGRTVLVSHALAFPTRLLAERLGAPGATLHLAPAVMRSDYLAPALPPARDLSPTPRWLKRGIWWLADHFYIDPHILPALNALRADLGLPPVRRVFESQIHSPQLTVGLFPDWFAPPQPDWPRQVTLTGFPLFDDGEMLDPQLDELLTAGDPPLVFTPGSANLQAPAFFRAAIEAARRLGRRALLLTRFSDQLPARLPDSAHHVSWAPLSRLLSRCAAIIHHGGIGTCAQGLAAGIPQLTMPMGFDQPDNTLRLVRLGVGAYLAPKKFTGGRLAEALQPLLDSAKVADACQRYRGLTRSADGIARTCDLLEALDPPGRVAPER